jgi:hypothetical protein
MILLSFLCMLGMLVSVIGFLQTVQPVHADIREGDFEVQGWCVTGPDPVFDDAVAIETNPDALHNDRKHGHVGDLIKDGFIPNRESLYGRGMVIPIYWTENQDGKHANAYVPTSDKSMGIHFTDCLSATTIPATVVNEYLAPSIDQEAQRQKGLGSSGQTNSEQGKRRGEE